MPRWKWVRVFSLLLRPVRDWLYDRIAQNRYRLFGRTESCMAPSPDLLRRFIFEEGDVKTKPAQP
jgi:predicted DCC family thiol-disulfide oxidoreductase YuxK